MPSSRFLTLLLGSLVVACSKDTSGPPDGPKSAARVKINPVPAPVATRSIAVGGVIRGQINPGLHAPYSFDVFVDGVQEKRPDAPYGSGYDSPMIFAQKTADSLEFYYTLRGVVPNGTHAITVKVADSSGIADSATAQISVAIPDARFSATPLRLPAGDVEGSVSAINVAGDVDGLTKDAAGHTHVTLWRNGVPSIVLRSDTLEFTTGGMNDRDDIVGTAHSLTDIYCYKAFIVSPGGAPSFVDPGYPCGAYGIDINNLGSVVVNNVSSVSAGVLQNGNFTKYGTAAFNAINDSNVVIGRLFLPPNYRASAAFIQIARTSSASLAVESMVPGTDADVVAVNNRMHAAIWSHFDLGPPRSWSLRLSNSSSVSLRPALGGYNTDFDVFALNNDDVALAFADGTPYLYKDGAVSRIVVTTPGITMTQFVGMNDAGVIIGMATLQAGAKPVPVVLTPAG